MDWDHLPAARRRPRVDGVLADYLRHEVLPFSETESARFVAAGIDIRGRGVAAELARLPPLPVGEVDGIAAVLRPSAASLAHSPQRLAWWWAGLTRRRPGYVEARRLVADQAATDALGSVRLVLVAGWMEEPERLDLAARLPSAAVRWAWAPPGVRALWAECRAGSLHTWPDTEVVEVLDGRDRPTVDVGSVVWTPVGWRGTVVLRLRTGARARLVDVPCPCGAASPRVEAVRPPGSDDLDAVGHLEQVLGAVLDREPLVAAWQAEADADAREVAVLRLAPVRGGRSQLEADLARLGQATAARRAVVERPSLVGQRLAGSGGARVVRP